MDIKLVKENDMPLMGRKRLTYMCSFDGSTPSRADFKNHIAKDKKVEPSLVIVKHIYQRFGSRDAKIIANVYHKKEMIDLYEEKNPVAENANKKSKENEKSGSEEKTKA